MEQKISEVKINGVPYVPKDSIPQMAACLDGMEYCMVRTYSAGVFAGYVESRNGKEVVLRNARRIWYWSGAATLSQLAMDGTSKPNECKFPVAVDRVILTEMIEMIPITEKAKKSIEDVPVWSCGCGSGSGSGSGSGYGSGSSSGYGYDDGSGYGSGSTCGSGSDDGSGSG